MVPKLILGELHILLFPSLMRILLMVLRHVNLLLPTYKIGLKLLDINSIYSIIKQFIPKRIL